MSIKQQEEGQMGLQQEAYSSGKTEDVSRIRQAVEHWQAGERAGLTEKKEVKVKFRPRGHHKHRQTNRISCLKDQRERGVGNVSFDVCKSGCPSAVKIEENGVWCSYQ